MNFHFKCSRVYQTVQKALEYQFENYRIEPDEKILPFIRREFIKSPKRTEDEMYAISLEHEPRDKTIDNPFAQFSSSTDEIAPELIKYRTIEFLQIFGINVTPKNLNQSSNQTTNDFIQVKTDQLKNIFIPPSFRGNQNFPNVTHIRRSASLTISYLSPVADEKEIIAHMKLPHRGIHQEVELLDDGSYEIFFFSENLIAWLAKNLANGTRFKAIDVVQRLLENKYIVALDGSDISETWRENPDIKLVFQTDNSVVPVRRTTPHLSTRLIITERKKINYEQLALEMRHPQSGVKLKTRKWLLKKYHDCFVGEEAVSWLLHHLDLTNREEVERIGQRMLDQGLIRHVSNDHPFLDRQLYYVFTKQCKLQNYSFAAGDYKNKEGN